VTARLEQRVQAPECERVVRQMFQYLGAYDGVEAAQTRRVRALEVDRAEVEFEEFGVGTALASALQAARRNVAAG
jgi:hypothetical protein